MYVDHPEHVMEAAEWRESQAKQGRKCDWMSAFHGTNGEGYAATLSGGAT